MAEETITILRVNTEQPVRNIKDLRDNIKYLKDSLNELTIGTEAYQKVLQLLNVNQNALRGAMNGTTATIDDVNASARGLITSYNSLVNQMAALRKEQRNIDVATDEGKRQYADMARQINAVNDQLKALDAQNGNFQRNVGNYESAFNGLNVATAQIVRELPSASVSLNTFFLAISNNIPMLVDQINLLRSQNSKLIAEGKQGINILSAVAKSFLSWNTGITLVITAVTLFGDEIGNFITNLFRGKDAVDANRKALEDYNTALNDASKAEAEATVTSRLLYDVATDTTRSMDERLSAVRQLKHEYPEYLGNLDDETILTGQAKVAYDRLNKSLVENARTRAYLNAITEQQASIVDTEMKRADALDRLSKAQEGLARNEEAYQRAVEKAGGSGMAALSQDVQLFSQQAAKAQDQINDISKEIAAYDAQIQAVNDTIGKLQANVNVDYVTEYNPLELADVDVNNQAVQLEVPLDIMVDDEDLQEEVDKIIRELQREVKSNASFALGQLSQDTEIQKQRAELETSSETELSQRIYDIEQGSLQKRLDLLSQFSQEALAAGDMTAYLNYQQQVADAEVQIQLNAKNRLDQIQQQKVNAVSQGVKAVGSVLGSLADMYEADAENSEEAARQAKNLQIASATINTISGAIAAFMTAQQLGFPWGTIIGAAQFATVLATGMAQITKIRNTEIDKDSSPSGISAFVSAPAVTPQVSNVRNVTSASEEDRLNQMASSQRVYILFSDIEASLNQRKVQVQEASF